MEIYCSQFKLGDFFFLISRVSIDYNFFISKNSRDKSTWHFSVHWKQFISSKSWNDHCGRNQNYIELTQLVKPKKSK
jgi:hypothetical protein